MWKKHAVLGLLFLPLAVALPSLTKSTNAIEPSMQTANHHKLASALNALERAVQPFDEPSPERALAKWSARPLLRSSKGLDGERTSGFFDWLDEVATEIHGAIFGRRDIRAIDMFQNYGEFGEEADLPANLEYLLANNIEETTILVSAKPTEGVRIAYEWLSQPENQYKVVKTVASIAIAALSVACPPAGLIAGGIFLVTTTLIEAIEAHKKSGLKGVACVVAFGVVKGVIMTVTAVEVPLDVFTVLGNAGQEVATVTAPHLASAVTSAAEFGTGIALKHSAEDEQRMEYVAEYMDMIHTQCQEAGPEEGIITYEATLNGEAVIKGINQYLREKKKKYFLSKPMYDHEGLPAGMAYSKCLKVGNSNLAQRGWF